jgi:hypothetical protein
MELVLNIVWALVTCAAFVFLLPKGRGGRAAVIGLACVAALLFPIISASDDLSMAAVASDAFSLSKSAVLPVASMDLSIALAAIAFIEQQVVPAVVRLLPAESDPRSPPYLHP